jgi:hypothetical protein
LLAGGGGHRVRLLVPDLVPMYAILEPGRGGLMVCFL